MSNEIKAHHLESVIYVETFTTKCNKYKVEKNYQLTLGNTFSLLFTVANRKVRLKCAFTLKVRIVLLVNRMKAVKRWCALSGLSPAIGKML